MKWRLLVPLGYLLLGCGELDSPTQILVVVNSDWPQLSKSPSTPSVIGCSVKSWITTYSMPPSGSPRDAEGLPSQKKLSRSQPS